MIETNNIDELEYIEGWLEAKLWGMEDHIGASINGFQW